jgi:uncharacterized damage-inducible protein DinB
MKELLMQYAAYNSWAHKKIFDALKQLSDEQISQEVESSFNSIFKTVLHLLDAESIWWQRIKLAEHIEKPSDSFSGNFEALQQKLLDQSKLWEEWVGNAGEHQLQHVFAYQNSKKEQFKQPMYQMLLHLFNHGTYHHGQLITMMRQMGAAKIPETDFIVFSRMKK